MGLLFLLSSYKATVTRAGTLKAHDPLKHY